MKLFYCENVINLPVAVKRAGAKIDKSKLLFTSLKKSVFYLQRWGIFIALIQQLQSQHDMIHMQMFTKRTLCQKNKTAKGTYVCKQYKMA